METEAQTARTLLGLARTQLHLGRPDLVRGLAVKIRQAHQEMLRWIGEARQRGTLTTDIEKEAADIFTALRELERQLPGA